MLTYKNTLIFGIISALVLIFLRLTYAVSSLWIILLFLIITILVIIGSFHIRWNFFIKSLHKSPNKKLKRVAITFDDGPHSEFTNKALALLEKHNAKGTFFCIGINVQKNPETIKKVIEKGHEIGNHSYVHTNNYGFLPTEEVQKDILKNNKLIAQITGKTPLLFRPPFGVTNPNIAKAIKALAMTSIGWSVRSFDTKSASAQDTLDRILPKIQNGDIILLHDTSDLSIEVLEQLLYFLEENNLKSVTVSELLKIDAYQE